MLNISFQKHSLSHIHQMLLKNKMEFEQTVDLGKVHEYLQEFFYRDSKNELKNLDYQTLQRWDFNTASQKLGKLYFVSKEQAKNQLAQTSLRDIHTAILCSDSIGEAAARLGLYVSMVKEKLEHFVYNDANYGPCLINFSILKRMDQNNAFANWNNAYDATLLKPTAPPVKIEPLQPDPIPVKIESITQSNVSFFSQAPTENTSAEDKKYIISLEALAKIIGQTASKALAAAQLKTSEELLDESLAAASLTYEDIKLNTSDYFAFKVLNDLQSVTTTIITSSSDRGDSKHFFVN